MIGLTYTKSAELEEKLKRIENLRKNILLTPLNPKTELKLRFEKNLERLYYSSLFIDIAVSKKQIGKLLMGEGSKKLTDIDRQLLNYKRVLDYLRDEWLVTDRMVTTGIVLKIAEILYEGTKVSFSRPVFRTLEETLKNLLSYLQGQDEHPCIQAAIIYAQLPLIGIFEDKSETVARLAGYLFLYKRGFDIKGLLTLEEYLLNNKRTVKELISDIAEKKNLNRFLDFFLSGIIQNLEKINDEIVKEQVATSAPASFFHLSERQKAILELMQQPEMALTNKKMQRKFRISQITASRDLSKLASLGLLLPHGKGRSIYYTRA